jgi:hypothetical protein
LYAKVGHGNAADHAVRDVGGQRLALLCQRQGGGGIILRDKDGKGVFRRQTRARAQFGGDVGIGGGIPGCDAGGRQQRVECGAQIKAKVGTEAVDGGHAGGAVGVEAHRQQVFEPGLLRRERRVGIVKCRAQGFELRGIGIARHRGKGCGARRGRGIGQLELHQRGGDQPAHPGIGAQLGDVGFRRGSGGAAGQRIGERPASGIIGQDEERAIRFAAAEVAGLPRRQQGGGGGIARGDQFRDDGADGLALGVGDLVARGGQKGVSSSI